MQHAFSTRNSVVPIHVGNIVYPYTLPTSGQFYLGNTDQSEPVRVEATTVAKVLMVAIGVVLVNSWLVSKYA